MEQLLSVMSIYVRAVAVFTFMHCMKEQSVLMLTMEASQATALLKKVHFMQFKTQKGSCTPVQHDLTYMVCQ